MTTPAKTDATTPCQCGGTMKIAMVEPLTNDPAHMQHTFVCACGETASFKFARKVAPPAN